MPAVAAVAKRILAVATERELPFWEAVGRAFMAWCAVELGKIDEGIVTLVRRFEIFRGANLVYWMPTYLCWLADAYRRSGEATRARECLARAREIMARGGECWYEAESWRIEGVLLAREPNEGRRHGAPLSAHLSSRASAGNGASSCGACARWPSLWPARGRRRRLRPCCAVPWRRLRASRRARTWATPKHSCKRWKGQCLGFGFRNRGTTPSASNSHQVMGR